MVNRIDELFRRKNRNILSIFFTAGYPQLTDTLSVLEALDEAGVDMVEVGMPFSDPVADGPVIQASSVKALENGMSLERLFRDLGGMRPKVRCPVVLMGYFNPVLQYGIERFFRSARDAGVDGVILPDLPPDEFRKCVQPVALECGIRCIFLLTPSTSDARIRELDELSEGFLYGVSSSAITGGAVDIDTARRAYFEKLSRLKLRNPVLIGFGISDRRAFEEVCSQLPGAVVGTAFIKALGASEDVRRTSAEFLTMIRGGSE